jgi:hypothetical protein
MMADLDSDINGVDHPLKWRFSKEVSLGLLAYLIVQTVFGIVFINDLSSSVKSLVLAQAAALLTAYSKEDARHEREFMDLKFTASAHADEEIVRRISVLEGQVAELRSSARGIR